MFMGIVMRPLPYRNVNGKILLKRVSEDIVISALTSHTQFSDDVYVNMSLKNGDWRPLILEHTEMYSDEMVLLVAQNYCLDGYVTDRLEIYTTTLIGNNRNTTDIKLDDLTNIFSEQIQTDVDKTLPKVNVSTNDISLCVRYREVDLVTRDTTCDSDFMAGDMRRIEVAL